MDDQTAGYSEGTWTQWLLHDRFGGDPQVERQYRSVLGAVRDRILRRAGITNSSILMDVGCGDGLLGFGAFEKNAELAKVIFTDVSPELVEYCRKIATQKGVADRCEFVVSDVSTLAQIADESVDVIVSRAVLMYLTDRGRSFRAFYRVLKPGGRLSICEPVIRIGYEGQPDLLRGTNFDSVADLKAQIDSWYQREYPDDPTRDFDADNLMNLAEAAGFRNIQTWRGSYSFPTPARNWDAILKMPPFPGMSPLARLLDSFSAEDRERFERKIRPQVESGGVGQMRGAEAYLIARK